MENNKIIKWFDKNDAYGSLYLRIHDNPDFSEGDYFFFGNPNRYDNIAKRKDIDFSDKPIQPVFSGYKMYMITEIEEGWDLKEGLSGSWYSRGDYSNNPDFRRSWTCTIKEIDMMYELADFLE